MLLMQAFTYFACLFWTKLVIWLIFTVFFYLFLASVANLKRLFFCCFAVLEVEKRLIKNIQMIPLSTEQ